MAQDSIEQQLKTYSQRPIQDRKTWYAPVAEAYDRARPKYPQEICDRILQIAELRPNAKLLEIGCGPGTATVNFAQHGFDILCLEPNPAFYELARRNCAPYPNVTILNLALEEWPLEAEKFDLAYAANAFHWIPADVGYPKVADTLKSGGALALLWNMNLEPSADLWERLETIFQTHAPNLLRYEGLERQDEILIELGQMLTQSARFEPPCIESICCEHSYNVEDYITLLSTYSYYIKLPEIQRLGLFEDLRTTISQWGKHGHIQLFNRCGFQLSHKICEPNATSVVNG